MSLKRIVTVGALACHLLVGIPLNSDSIMAQGLRTTTATFWQGEPFLEGEGGVLFQILLNQNLTRQRVEMVVVKLYLPSQARHYLLNYRPALQSQGASQVWRLPVGNYRVHEIEFRGQNDFVSRWNGKGEQEFLIQSGRLVNFGRWYAIALPDKQVRVIFREPNTGQESSASQLSPAAAKANPIASGSGQLSSAKQQPSPSRNSKVDDRSINQGQRPMGQGSSSIGIPTNNQPTKKELRAVYQFQRKLELVYQVNLMRDNRFSSVFMESIKRYDANFRECITGRFDDLETLQGLIRFKFIYSGAEQIIKNLVLSESTMGDKSFVECMYWQILGINFPVRENLVGEFAFQFQLQTQ